jgi:hypothetical protein
MRSFKLISSSLASRCINHRGATVNPSNITDAITGQATIEGAPAAWTAGKTNRNPVKAMALGIANARNI